MSFTLLYALIFSSILFSRCLLQDFPCVFWVLLNFRFRFLLEVPFGGLFSNHTSSLAYLLSQTCFPFVFLLEVPFGGPFSNHTSSLAYLLSQTCFPFVFLLEVPFGGLKWTRTTDLTLIRRAL